MTALHFTASPAPGPQAALLACVARYGQVPAADAQVVVALGGDGFMLSVLQRMLASRTRLCRPPSVYGMHYGTVGFLMNRPVGTPNREVPDRVAAALPVVLTPLRVDAVLDEGQHWTRWAFNEVALRRTGSQAAALRVMVDGRERLPRLAGDGLLLATPAGSAAYNCSAGGPVLPLSAHAHALTAICPISPRRWPGAVLPSASRVGVEVLERDKRPVTVSADTHEADGAHRLEIVADPAADLVALFDEGHDLDERLLAAQFPAP